LQSSGDASRENADAHARFIPVGLPQRAEDFDGLSCLTIESESADPASLAAAPDETQLRLRRRKAARSGLK
jgi:hypothetical protein